MHLRNFLRPRRLLKEKLNFENTFTLVIAIYTLLNRHRSIFSRGLVILTLALSVWNKTEQPQMIGCREGISFMIKTKGKLLIDAVLSSKYFMPKIMYFDYNKQNG